MRDTHSTYWRFTITVVASAALLTGCAASQSGGSPSPTADGAPIERWAGLVAERQLDTEDWYASWSGAACSALTADQLDCNSWLLVGALIAQTNDIVIAGPSDPSAKTYLGPVPAEIADLYAETIATTGAARTAAQAWQDAECGVGVGGDCVSLAFDLERAMDSVRQTFASWAPYL